PIEEAVHVARELHTRSHSLPSLRSTSPAVTITILPLGSTSTRATTCPAAATASTALLRSAVRNMTGPRATVRIPACPHSERPRRSYVTWPSAPLAVCVRQTSPNRLQIPPP